MRKSKSNGRPLEAPTNVTVRQRRGADSGPTRRSILQAGAFGTAWAALPRAVRASPTRHDSRSTNAIKHFIHLFLQGGTDSLYGWDPKSPNQVASGITIPYDADRIIERGPVRAAPYIAPISPYLDRFTALNGVQVSTVAHPIGVVQSSMMQRRPIMARDHTITSRAAAALNPDAAIHEVRLGQGEGQPSWQHPIGRTIVLGRDAQMVKTLEALREPEILQSTVEAFDRQAAKGLLLGDRLSTARAFVEGLQRLDPITYPTAESSNAPLGIRLDDRELASRKRDTESGLAATALAVNLLKNEVTPTVYLELPVNMDSHELNHFVQCYGHDVDYQCIAWLLEALATTPSPHGGTLEDHTAILITSEFGRFPYINVRKGKDHYPVGTVVMRGPGLNPGTFGETDKELNGVKMSPRTGKRHDAGQQIFLEDVGRTIAEWIGFTREDSAAFDGTVLEYLLA